jgi:urea carboxylase-associated protein 1
MTFAAPAARKMRGVLPTQNVITLEDKLPYPQNLNLQDQQPQIVPAGGYWLGVVPKGRIMRLTDSHGNQAVDTLFFNADDFSDRYSAMQTIQAQRALYLTKGSVLRSELGIAMAEIIEDTCGRHDTLGGACAAESNTVRYAHETKTMHSCRDSWLLALNTEYADLRLEKSDLSHNVNFFMNVPVTPDGKLTFEDGVSGPGKYVDILAHMNLAVLISNCPQLNNPCNGYNPTPIQVEMRLQ